jgi:hypothetical protein
MADEVTEDGRLVEKGGRKGYVTERSGGSY